MLELGCHFGDYVMATLQIPDLDKRLLHASDNGPQIAAALLKTKQGSFCNGLWAKLWICQSIPKKRRRILLAANVETGIRKTISRRTFIAADGSLPKRTQRSCRKPGKKACSSHHDASRSVTSVRRLTSGDSVMANDLWVQPFRAELLPARFRASPAAMSLGKSRLRSGSMVNPQTTR